jgi:hypothetical protein
MHFHAESGCRDNTGREDQPGVLSFETFGHVCQPTPGLENAISMYQVFLARMLVDNEVAS